MAPPQLATRQVRSPSLSSMNCPDDLPVQRSRSHCSSEPSYPIARSTSSATSNPWVKIDPDAAILLLRSPKRTILKPPEREGDRF
ncbi:hypothetical protein JJD41_15940 [Oxynema sp. CENA135]|uniref:hypothetical protein n=1 Tax=Oxynema sp. CENA135 TaxID=984206 RepID=UPI00190AC22C|nr:hypothetical protein [Oxynema sp. CENA135]MBK4731341.1 hypothetical protein [Oxynema sp. CENA135]